MESLSLKEVITAVNGQCFHAKEEVIMNHVSTDSRKTEKGNLYIALQGENFDGHDFIEAAISKGAVAIISAKPVIPTKEIPIILVENTLKAMWQLATYYRGKLCKPVIAITGSVGKTSTKDMVSTILSARYVVHKSQGNFNNHIGLPVTLLKLENKHDVVVVEMGMRGLGEISTLTKIAKPTIAMITNIGLSHIERLGTTENILRAKLEIVEGLNENGVLILNGNDPMLQNIDPNSAKKIVYIGIDTPADYMAYSVKDLFAEGVEFKIQLNNQEYVVHMPTVGKHNVYNALFGIACGFELGMKPEEIIEGIKHYQPEQMRLNLIEKNGIQFIDDSYNASPDSMRAGLQVLGSLAKGGRAIAILGNMFELGHMSSAAHYEVGLMCKENGLEFAAIIGENARDIARGIGDNGKFKIFATHEEIVQYMKEYLRLGDVVLVKGSRGMKMERILELW